MTDLSLRAEQVEGTRQAILAAARSRFGRLGYAATSLDDVARDARVTKGAVYHHFGSKVGLFRAVYDVVEAEARARTASSGVEGNAVDVIVAGMHAYLDAALDPEIQRITLIDGPAVLGLEPDGPGEEDPGHAALRDFIRLAIDNQVIAPVDPDALAHLIRGACLQAGLLIARAPDHEAARRRIGEALEAMIRGLAPRRTRSRR